ncbi:MAG: hypothetical protein PW792_05770 [Acidobacteriaceae bacterium]|nr:hypothetical protein [Acidobacteriaceae bacterium]
MEVHPPEHGIHSWRDFLVHMGTITLGLLIAIGLEQSAEWFHHREQRNRLIEQMRVEADTNVLICRHVIDLRLRPESQILGKWGEVLRATPDKNNQVVVRVPEVLRTLDSQIDENALLPTIPVWTTAKQSELVPLLPGETTQFYDSLDHTLGWIDTMAHSEVELSSEYDALVRSISGRPVAKVLPLADTLHMTVEQRQRIVEMLANFQVHNEGLIAETVAFQSISESIQAGTMTMEGYKDRLNHHPDTGITAVSQVHSNK